MSLKPKLFLLVSLTWSLLVSDLVYAKSQNELGLDLSYFDQVSKDGDNQVTTNHFGLDLEYLRLVNSFWLGGLIGYGSTRSSSGSTSRMILGLPAKYWFVGPESKGIGAYFFSTVYLGRQDLGQGGKTIFGFKLGPGFAYFLSDLVGADWKLFYDYQRQGSATVTTTGFTLGFSFYF